jgi:monovalent cation/hydrogen antiporter
MRELEQILGLFVAAVILADAARRVGAPYPVFLALGGALLRFFQARSRSVSLPSLRWRSLSHPCC